MNVAVRKVILYVPIHVMSRHTAHACACAAHCTLHTAQSAVALPCAVKDLDQGVVTINHTESCGNRLQPPSARAHFCSGSCKDIWKIDSPL